MSGFSRDSFPLQTEPIGVRIGQGQGRAWEWRGLKHAWQTILTLKMCSDRIPTPRFARVHFARGQCRSLSVRDCHHAEEAALRRETWRRSELTMDTAAPARRFSQRLSTLRQVLSVFLFLTFLSTCCIEAKEPSRPNFVFILADDLGWSSLSCRMDERVPNSRSDYHETPNLDRLAKAGMRFTSGHAPAAICCPTRRSIQFGQTPTRQGNERFQRDYDPVVHPRLTIPKLLKAADARYRTAHYGKWDLRADIFPEDLGYDESDGNTGNKNGDISTDKDTKFTAHYLNNDPKRIETLTARSLNFIRRNNAAGNPFFLQLSHYATHVDIQTKPETYAKYAGRKKGEVHTDPAWAGMQENLDEGIGRILDLIEELGIAGNTYVIFMADNGGVEFIPPVKNKMDPPSAFKTSSRNHPLRGGKWVLYEGGIRVPFLVAGPGIKPGTQCDVPVVGWDLLPTIADLAGYSLPLPADLDGGSFRGWPEKGSAQ